MTRHIPDENYHNLIFAIIRRAAKDAIQTADTAKAAEAAAWLTESGFSDVLTMAASGAKIINSTLE